ncbi:MAG: phospho-sugar mutase, partial [Fusobacteriaceae bacterium]
LYGKYGWYKEGITAITKKGKEGMAEIFAIMEKLRERRNCKELIGEKVVVFKDFKNSIEVDFKTGETKKIDLPVSDVIQFILADNTYITARPSGTEPKMKYYYCIKAETEKASQEKLKQVMKRFEEMV